MKSRAQFLFGDIVVVSEDLIGVIVKTWERSNGSYYYEVYVRMFSQIKEYEEHEIERYRVRHKFLNEEELGWQNEY